MAIMVIRVVRVIRVRERKGARERVIKRERCKLSTEIIIGHIECLNAYIYTYTYIIRVIRAIRAIRAISTHTYIYIFLFV